MNIYSFVGDDGENIHIDAQSLRRWCMSNKKLEICMIPLRVELAKEMVRDNVVSTERIVELSRRRHLDPIIMCKDGTFSKENGGPNALIVDGHHRFVLACLAKMSVIPGYFLNVEQWKPFQLYGIPDMTREQLIKAPITKRDY
jgi:hypothetical protein